MSVTRILCPNGCGVPIAFCVCPKPPADALDPVKIAREALGEAIDRLFVAGNDATDAHLHAPDEALAAFESAVRQAALDEAILAVERTRPRDPRHSSVDRDDTSYATLSEDTNSDIVAALHALKDPP